MTLPADGRGGSTPPRPAARAGGWPQQWFVFRPWLFDVTAAIELLHRVPRAAQPLPVMAWARAYGLIPGPGSTPHSVPLIGPGPEFDSDYAMTTDLDDPVIIASLTVAGEPPAPLLIDGCHRLYKAARLGREHLPSLVLTAEETLSIRRPAILMPGHTAPPGGKRAERRPNHDHDHGHDLA